MWQKIKNNLQARWWKRGVQNHLPNFQLELADIVTQHPDQKIIIFPPGLGWLETKLQRPQHLAQALANQGILVPYVLTMTWNYKFAAQISPVRIIYDYVDHLQAFSGNQTKLEHDHTHLIQIAELILATSVPLFQEVLRDRSDAILCPNGVDYAHFAMNNNTRVNPPAEIAPLLLDGSPIIGYSGALARWFDYDLLETTASLRPDLQFLLIGPDFDNSLPAKLLELPNLTWLGPKPYLILPGYMHFFDVAMIPFSVNDLTHAVSPLKLFEYMAAGKPVVITPMEESMRYPGVLVAQDSQEFSARIDEALELRADQDYLQTIQKVANENTWQVRAQQIKQALVDESNSPILKT
jgi:glycosyltransferase involved in cell wall biosynthesis